MNGTRLTFVRRGSALLLAAVVGGAAVACASSKTPATQDSQAARATMDRGPDGGPRGPGRGDARLFEGITLSDTQRAKIDSIRASYRERMRAARDSGGDRSQFRQMMEEQRMAIRAVLTSEQQQTFDRNVQQMRDERGRRGPGGGGPDGR